MDNYFTGRRDQSRQMAEKAILYRIPAGLVMECVFARWRIILPPSRHADFIASFSFAHGVCRRVFLELRNVKIS